MESVFSIIVCFIASPFSKYYRNIMDKEYSVFFNFTSTECQQFLTFIPYRCMIGIFFPMFTAYFVLEAVRLSIFSARAFSLRTKSEYSKKARSILRNFLWNKNTPSLHFGTRTCLMRSIQKIPLLYFICAYNMSESPISIPPAIINAPGPLPIKACTIPAAIRQTPIISVPSPTTKQ